MDMTTMDWDLDAEVDALEEDTTEADAEEYSNLYKELYGHRPRLSAEVMAKDLPNLKRIAGLL